MWLLSSSDAVAWSDLTSLFKGHVVVRKGSGLAASGPSSPGKHAAEGVLRQSVLPFMRGSSIPDRSVLFARPADKEDFMCVPMEREEPGCE